MEKVDFKRDYYADLQLQHDAGLQEIQIQYRKLAIQYHPDRNPGQELESAAKLGVIYAAYKVLSDPTAKQQYDDQIVRKHAWPIEDPGSSSRGTGDSYEIAPSVPSFDSAPTRHSRETWLEKPHDPPAEAKPSGETTTEDSDPTSPTSHTEGPVDLYPMYLSEVLRDWGASSRDWLVRMTPAHMLNSSYMFELSDVFDVLSGKVYNELYLNKNMCNEVTGINCEWKLPYQIRTSGHAGPGTKGFLADHKVLVATRGERLAKLQVEATTCIDYVKRIMGEKGCELLADLENALSGNTLQESYHCHQVKTITYDENKIFLNLRPDVVMDADDLWSISNTLSWVCSAVRTETRGPYVLSSTLCNLGLDNKDFTLNLSVHDISLPHIENNCWLPLFEVGVVSLGPRQLMLNQFDWLQIYTINLESLRLGRLTDNQFKEPGRGLKVSFDLLLQLSAVEYPVKVNDKIMLVGYQTALLPVRSGPRYVQFHLIVDEENQINPYILDSSHCIPWDDNAIAEMRRKDCYIGWCKSARILLGTDSLSVANITYSDTPMKEKSLRLDGFGAALQAASTAPLQAGGSLQANFRYQTNRLRFSPSNVFSHLLRNASKELACVYDPITKRAWIVPKLSLLLHMCHAWEDVNNIKKRATPFLPSHIDPSQVPHYIEVMGDVMVCGDGNDALSLRTLLLRLNLNLLQCFENTEAAKKRLFSGVDLYGFDFMDIITEPGRGCCMRTVSLGPQAKAWLPLVKSADALVICSGIGDVVRATLWNEQRCVHCVTPPSGRDYLTTTVQCLKTIISRNGKEMPEILKEPILDISNDSYLVLGEQVFRDCNNKLTQKNGEACWDASRFQHLEVRKKMGVVFKGKADYLSQPLCEDGAIVLGCSGGQ